MQLDAIIEVAIGLVFVWLVISITTMEAQNRLGVWMNGRAKHLEKSIHSMLKDKTLVDRFYDHPLIVELMLKDDDGNLKLDKKGKPRRPDYIPTQVFATAVFEVLMNAGKGEKDIAAETLSIPDMTANFKTLMAKNEVLPYVFPNMEKSMETLQRNTKEFDDKLAEYRRNIEGWFDNVMVQASGWYKIDSQWKAFWIGLALAVFFNVDTIFIAQKLWQEPTARAVIVAQAQTEAQGDSPADSISLDNVKGLVFPVGWTTTPLAEGTSCGLVSFMDNRVVISSEGNCLAVTSLPAFNNGWGLMVKIFGYLLTAFAAAQGAPFWFDILRKLVGFKQQTSSTSK
ncbi:MAG TPA: hypothetical protein PKN81_05485 [Anaerolineales bacterium]|nr:hypothetical protein [Anaerolineales bacterium]